MAKKNLNSWEFQNISGGNGGKVQFGIRKNGQKGYYVIEDHVPIVFSSDESKAESIYKERFKENKDFDYLRNAFPGQMLPSPTAGPKNRSQLPSTSPIIEEE